MATNERKTFTFTREVGTSKKRVSLKANALDTLEGAGFNRNTEVDILSGGQFSIIDLIEAVIEITERIGERAPKLHGPEFEAYCGTIVRLRDAQRRIKDEELIVPDPRNNPVAHPAFQIERQCNEELRKWGNKYQPR